jgi:hypothetical protein
MTHARSGFWVVLAGLSLVLACGDSGDGDSGDDGDDGDDGAPYAPPFESCAGESEPPAPPDDSLCLGAEGDDPDAPPLAVIEQEFVTYEGIEAVHLRLVLSPDFVDNTYGANAVGWIEHDHKFRDLVGSDHADIVMLDTSGDVIFDLSLDFLSEDPDAPCGYSCLGVAGGEGEIRTGEESAILAWTSSMDDNLNARGYCEDYLVDSPATDADCTANADAPDWDFRVVYEVWVRRDAFDPAGFGSAFMSYVHASPSKADENTLDVVPETCPCVEDVDTGECEGGPPGECVPGECGDGQYCDEGTCTPCTPDIDTGECDPPGICTDDGDCNDGEFCYDGNCLMIVD